MKKLKELMSHLREGLSGDDSAMERVEVLLYEHLNSLKASQQDGGDILLSQKWRQSVQLDEVDLSINERAHLLSIAAGQIKRILSEASTHQRCVENFTSSDSQEPVARMACERKGMVSGQHEIDFLTLDEHLKQLSELDDRKATLFELSYFGGMDYEEISEIIAVPVTMIDRELRFVRAWVSKQLKYS